MDLQKLNPWNWFKHEEPEYSGMRQIPVRRSANERCMPSIYGNTAHSMMQLHQEMDRLIDDAFRGFGFPSLGSQLLHMPSFNFPDLEADRAFHPSLNVSSDDQCYQITLEAPGLKVSDVDIEVKGDVLTVHGEKQEETEDNNRHYYRVERRYGMFQRTLALPDDANPDEIQASMKDGVLRLNIPRRETVDSRVKKIPINSLSQ